MDEKEKDGGIDEASITNLVPLPADTYDHNVNYNQGRYDSKRLNPWELT